MPIFGRIDTLWRGTENTDANLLQSKREIIGLLSTHRDNNTGRLLFTVDLENRFECQFLKVKPVAFIVVGTNSLRIAIDDDGLMTQRA